MQKLAVGAVAVVAVVGAGAGVAATKLRTPQQESKAVLDDVAGQLGVSPQQLTNAFKTALKNRVDQAVEDGLLTQQQANRLKTAIDKQEVPMLGPGLHRGGPGGGHHFGFRMHKLEAAAKYLGMSQEALDKALQNGKTLAQVAKDQGKSVDGLVDALLAEHKAKIAQAVKNGKLTQKEADEFTAGLEKRLTDLVNGRFPRFDRNGPRFHRFDGPRESSLRPVPLLPTY
jgi:hypothetical protein